MRQKKTIRDKMRSSLYQKLVNGLSTTSDEITSDHEFLELRKYHDPNYDILYAKAYQAYIKGDWQEAGKVVKQCLNDKPDDGPAMSLNRVINIRYKGQKPDWWEGFRPLTSK